MNNPRMHGFRLGSLWVLLFLSVGVSAAQKVVGTTEFSRGAVAAQLGDATPRVLSKGSEIFELDFIEAGPQSFAVIQMIDDAKLTVRPNTGLSIDKYVTEKGRESADITLQRGGIRAASGRIAERRPGGMLVHAAKAVVEVHGANFDARLCRDDCAEEQARKAGDVAVAEDQAEAAVVGRVGLLRGQIRAVAAQGATRSIQLGGPLYVNDMLSTASGSHALLVFRDGERITLQESSEFLIAAHRYDAKTPSASNAAFKLLKGGVRTMTGAIGTRARENYKMETPVATTGIRGTIFDHYCEGDCRSEQGVDAGQMGVVQRDANARRPDGLYTQVIEGAIEQKSAAGTFVLQAGQSNYVASPDVPPVPFQQTPTFMTNNPAPRPDTVPVNMEQLFGAESLEGAPPGVYVYTRAGSVKLRSSGEPASGSASSESGSDDGSTSGGGAYTSASTGGGTRSSAGTGAAGSDSVNLGQGETGYMGLDDGSQPTRVENEQAFMAEDGYPDPGSKSSPQTIESNYSVLSGDPENPESFSCVCPL